MLTDDEIFDKVREVLVDALAVDEEDVTPEANLHTDLDAESIDMLDINFRLEKSFSLKIPRGELFPESLGAADSPFVTAGKVNEKGLAELRQNYSHIDVSSFASDPRLENLKTLFTVATICKFMKKKLG